MGNSLIGGFNPLFDFLFLCLLYNIDISDKKMKDDLHLSLSYMLEFYLEDENDVKYLDFEIKKRNDKYVVKGRNIISALWLSGIIPKNTIKVLNENRFIFENIEYTFNEKSLKLILKKINNG